MRPVKGVVSDRNQDEVEIQLETGRIIKIPRKAANMTIGRKVVIFYNFTTNEIRNVELFTNRIPEMEDNYEEVDVDPEICNQALIVTEENVELLDMLKGVEGLDSPYSPWEFKQDDSVEFWIVILGLGAL